MKTLLRSAALGAVAFVAVACNNSSNVAVPVAPTVPTGRFVSTLVLSPDNEVPPVEVASTATGTAVVVLDTTTRSLSVSGSFSGLTSPALVVGPSVMHIHVARPEPGQTFAQATGPVFEGLNVNLNSDQLSGVFNTTDLLRESGERKSG